MSESVNINIHDGYISVSFDVADPKIMAVGEKMNEICDEAYMNGYNWEAFLNCYLSVNAPEILEQIDSDPEAEMYSAFIEEVNDETKALAVKFGELIEDLFNNEDKVYSFLNEYAEDIAWD